MQQPDSTPCPRCQTQVDHDRRTADLLSVEISLDRFRSGDVPSNAEIEELRQLSQDAQQEIDHFNTEIGRLREKVSRLQQRAHQFHAFTSLIRRVPPEIWVNIFTKCCASGGLMIYGDDVVADALKLSQTCTRWRAIAFSTPEFWSNLTLDFHVRAPESLVALCRHYLSRSHPFPITFSYYNRWYGEQPLILRMLWDFRSRWSRVTLKGFFSPQDCPSSAGFDNLEYLDISELLVDSDFPDVFKRAPKLITSCINDFDNDFPLPFSQLRCIQCNKAQNTQHIIDCLTTCTGLLQALITTEDRFISSVPEPSIVTHYGLTSLDLGVHQLEATHIFSHLCLPALVELSLRLISSSPRRPTSFSEIIPNLRSFLDRSSCQLRTLILGMSTEVPAENSNFFSELFALTPTINHLTIYALDFESPLDNLIHSLTLHSLEIQNTNSLPKRPPLLPWLTSLDLRFRLRNKGWSFELLPTLVPPNLDLILSMVRSRWCSAAEFEHTHEPMTELASFQFYLEIPPDTMPSVYDLAHKFSDDFEPGLRILEKDGLQLSVGLISSMFSGPAVV